MLKKFLIGTFFVAAFALVASTVSAYDFGTTTLRVGSKGPAVMTLQTLVGATADGNFGPMTAAKVKVWQAANGLTADGVFGPASMAKANGAISGQFPAGCTSAAGFSSTTGQSCAAVSSYPAGCTSTVGYSSTTGAKCDGGSTPAGELVGGAGDITVTETSTDVEDEIIEGETEKILGFKVEADGSDVAVKNLKIAFENQDATGSYRLADYAEKVEVYMGSTKVGSADVSDFSKDSHVYSKSISLTDATVREGSNKKATFYVVVTAVSNVDGDDIGENNWSILVNNIRFQDATGVIMTDATEIGSDTTGSFIFTDLSTSGDVDLTISKGASNPLAQTVKVSDTSSTNDLLMLEFKLKAEGSDASFDELTVTLDGDVATGYLDDMLSELVLKNGDDELASVSSFATASDDDTVTFDLDDTFTVDADSTETFRVYAKVNKIDTYFVEGDSLSVALAASGIAAEDENGDVISDSGSATGTEQTFTVDAPTFALVSKSLALSQSIDGVSTGEEDVFLAKFVFNVTAGDEDVYLPTSVATVEDTDGNNTYLVGFTQLASGNVDSATIDAEDDTLDDATTNHKAFLVAAGATEKFTLSYYIRAANASEKITIDQFNYKLTTQPADTGYTSAVASGLSAFATSSVYLAK